MLPVATFPRVPPAPTTVMTRALTYVVVSCCTLGPVLHRYRLSRCLYRAPLADRPERFWSLHLQVLSYIHAIVWQTEPFSFSPQGVLHGKGNVRVHCAHALSTLRTRFIALGQMASATKLSTPLFCCLFPSVPAPTRNRKQDARNRAPPSTIPLIGKTPCEPRGYPAISDTFFSFLQPCANHTPQMPTFNSHTTRPISTRSINCPLLHV